LQNIAISTETGGHDGSTRGAEARRQAASRRAKCQGRLNTMQPHSNFAAVCVIMRTYCKEKNYKINKEINIEKKLFFTSNFNIPYILIISMNCDNVESTGLGR
jgi:hypothetical protein